MSLGKYEIIEELGRGGFGTVYKAHDTVLDVDRALKVLHPTLVSDVTFLDRFKQEARLAARLDHPNIVPVYDYGEIDGRFFLAMKYMPGGSLKDILRQEKRLDEKRAQVILKQVCQGMAYAHQQGIVHRDLKPGNILFDQQGNACVSDLGFAKSLGTSASASLSSSGGMVGTPSYMAPEIWRGKPATPASDVYSLACIYYEMLTGKVLFDGESPADIVTKHVVDGPQIEKTLPKETVTVLEKALAKEPKKRFGDIVAFLQALKELREPVATSTIGIHEESFSDRSKRASDLYQTSKNVSQPDTVVDKNQVSLSSNDRSELPAGQNKDRRLSKKMIIAIAIIVPILIGAMAPILYNTFKNARHYNSAIAFAHAAATDAQSTDDPDLQRFNWYAAIQYSLVAKNYRQSAEIDRLVLQAETAIDALDGAIRLNYQTAVDGELPDEMVISRVIPVNSDLYLFDSTGGQIVHLIPGREAYTVDDSFSCFSGTYSGVVVGDLVGMVSITINNIYETPIMAMDSSGNLLFCAPGMSPQAASLVQPQGGIGNIKSILYDSYSGHLFILDPRYNALWVYSGSDLQFTGEPYSLFTYFPMDLTAAIDLAVNGDELYILFDDGHMATCNAPGFTVSQINCINPAQIIDPRENSPAIDFLNLELSQSLFITPPDPSVMLLASDTAEIFQLNRRLVLNRIYRGRFEKELAEGQEATAFALSSNRLAFLAFENELFYAVIP